MKKTRKKTRYTGQRVNSSFNELEYLSEYMHGIQKNNGPVAHSKVSPRRIVNKDAKKT